MKLQKKHKISNGVYIHRELENLIKPFIKRKEVLAIIGPRQVGKTTFLQYLNSQLERGGELVKFITFEKRSDLELFDNIEDFKDFHKKYQTIIIDEFQYAKQGGQKLKYLFDTTKTKYIISGSSSLDIKFQTGRYMVGRMLKFMLWPFSFREYLLGKNKALYELLISRVSDVFSSSIKKAPGPEINSRLEKLFEDYLIFGGYPAVVLSKSQLEKEKILESILDNYLLRDIKGLLQLATENELIRLIKFLAAQAGNLINYQELSNSCGLNYKELLRHLEILRQTYIIDLIKPYFTNKRTEITKNPKVYFVDTGFKNLALSDFRNLNQRKDMGSLVENYVFMALKRKTNGFQNINFWRTKSKAEVDFIIQKENKVIPIEVKYSSKPVIGKSLYSFIEKFSPSQCFVFTKNYAKEMKIKNCKIKFIPVYYL